MVLTYICRGFTIALSMKRLFELINKNVEGSVLRKMQRNKHCHLPIITISRERGSGGRPIAYLVVKKLKNPWRVFHKDIVDEIAHETALEKHQVAELDEHQSNKIKELIDVIFGQKFLSINSYYKHLLHILASIGTRGYAVIIGRGANFLFPDALKIRIVSTIEDRVQAMVKYEHISVREAKKQVIKSDEERTVFTKELFQHDQRKAHHYDLVIRTGKNINVEDAADMIVALAKKKFKI